VIYIVENRFKHPISLAITLLHELYPLAEFRANRVVLGNKRYRQSIADLRRATPATVAATNCMPFP
jgi:hypothetical protein